VSDNTLLLQQLMTIKQPEIIFWWPLAPGWWLLIYLLLFVLPGVFFFIHYHKPIRREALAELLRLEQSFSSSHDINQFAMDITIVLRRVALAKYDPADVAGLSGKKWLTFLNVHGKTSEFTQGAGRILLDVPYQSNNKRQQDGRFNEQALIELAGDWIRSNT